MNMRRRRYSMCDPSMEPANRKAASKASGTKNSSTGQEFFDTVKKVDEKGNGFALKQRNPSIGSISPTNTSFNPLHYTSSKNLETENESCLYQMDNESSKKDFLLESILNFQFPLKKASQGELEAPENSSTDLIVKSPLSTPESIHSSCDASSSLSNSSSAASGNFLAIGYEFNRKGSSVSSRVSSTFSSHWKNSYMANGGAPFSDRKDSPANSLSYGVMNTPSSPTTSNTSLYFPDENVELTSSSSGSKLTLCGKNNQGTENPPPIQPPRRRMPRHARSASEIISIDEIQKLKIPTQINNRIPLSNKNVNNFNKATKTISTPFSFQGKKVSFAEDPLQTPLKAKKLDFGAPDAFANNYSYNYNISTGPLTFPEQLHNYAETPRRHSDTSAMSQLPHSSFNQKRQSEAQPSQRGYPLIDLDQGDYSKTLLDTDSEDSYHDFMNAGSFLDLGKYSWRDQENTTANSDGTLYGPPPLKGRNSFEIISEEEEDEEFTEETAVSDGELFNKAAGSDKEDDDKKKFTFFEFIRDH